MLIAENKNMLYKKLSLAFNSMLLFLPLLLFYRYCRFVTVFCFFTLLPPSPCCAIKSKLSGTNNN